MGKLRPQFIEERAQALAIVHLTRHKGVEVIANARNSVFDLLLYLGEPTSPDTAMFAIEVRGMLGRGKRAEGHGASRFTVSHDIRVLQASPIPVCTFLFLVDDERGYFRWLHRPVTTPQGAEIVPDEPRWRAETDKNGQASVTNTFAALTDDAVRELFAEVGRWHRARQRSAMLLHAI